MFRPTQAGTLLLMMLLALGQPACTRPPEDASSPPPVAQASTAAVEESPAPPPAMGESAAPTDASSPGEVNGSPQPGKDASPMPALEGPYRGLKPFAGAKAPEITEVQTVRFETDEGPLVIEIYPQAAPNAAKRFLELVEAGFYDETPIFRIVPGFVAQFGVNWRGDHPKWQKKNFNDDPSLFRLEAGTLAFAKAGPNTNSTQVFINYADNSALREQGGFTTFGKIVEGMELTTRFKRVGDPSMGLDQYQLWTNGGKYLESLPANQKPTMIRKATVVKAPADAASPSPAK